jgi:ubiquinone/menaquinone biosynthesis C-methylase UbiE
MAIAQELLGDQAQGPGRVALHRADARMLPFQSGSFDRVFLLDVVEHIAGAELGDVLGEVYRVLETGGQAVIHTMPNTWYYRFGYPVYRALQRVRGQSLPADPRDRWAYSHVHVNEQNPVRLHRALRSAGFQTRVWLKSAQRYEHESSQVLRAGMVLLTSVYPFRWVFCNDIFAVATKPASARRQP